MKSKWNEKAWRHLINRRCHIVGHPTEVRTILFAYDDIPGGLRLNEPVDGFFSWNLERLILLPESKS